MIEEAEKNGWKVAPTNGGHLKWVLERTGAFFFSSSSPSDKWAFKHILGDIRRAEKITAKTVVALAFMGAAFCAQPRYRTLETTVKAGIACQDRQPNVPSVPQTALG